MLDSIFVAMTGLEGFSKGLKVISNNVANMNTPGFKSADLQFTNVMDSQQTGANNLLGGDGGQDFGSGLKTLATRIDFQAGETRQTDNALDLSISGSGLFVLQDQQGTGQHYSRAGQFRFDKDGSLVDSTTGKFVLGFGGTDSGTLSKISLTGLRTNAAKASSVIALQGNIPSNVTESDVNGVKLFDSLGAEHTLRLHVTDVSTANDPGSRKVEVFEGTTSLGTGTLTFTDGKPVSGHDSVSFTFQPSGGSSSTVKLDFSKEVTNFAGSSTSTLTVSSNDGFAAGAMTNASFDQDGSLSIVYSNGQTAKGPRIALATFAGNLGLVQASGGMLDATGEQAATVGRPGDSGLGSISGGRVELSNVDLASEFSNLIVMQRGYQASSHVVSTANDMIQQLFDMKGNR